jgi:hypothetical protein
MRFVRMKDTISYQKGDLVKYRLITWKEYLREMEWKMYGHKKESCPYRWWQFQYLYEVPAFYLIQLLFSKNSRLKALKPIHIAAKIAIIVVEATFTFLFTKYVLECIF